MALDIKNSASAKAYMGLHTKLKDLEATDVEIFVDLRNLEVHFKQTREFATSLVDAIVVLEKSLFIWIKELDDTYRAVDALGLSFSDAELVGF